MHVEKQGNPLGLTFKNVDGNGKIRTHGQFVASIKPGSIADALKISVGDQIVRINEVGFRCRFSCTFI